MSLKHIFLTTGDADGIGFEVTAKALAKRDIQENIQFYLFSSPNSELKYLDLIKNKYQVVRVQSIDEALLIQPQFQKIIEIHNSENPAHWVEKSAQICFKNKNFAMATAPLSKTFIQSSGLKDIGHTDILKRVSKASRAYMTFIGEGFSVCLLTGHIPLAKVAESLNSSEIVSLISLLDQTAKKLGDERPIGVLGLNPHAGEHSLIGSEEKTIIEPAIVEAQKNGHNVVGPLVPDAAFLRSQHQKYSFYLCLYHDQGLIPFKAYHGQESGIHLTLGIPFIRTSVDHGTAKDIFGQNIAQPNSMMEAIDWCIRLL